MLINKKSFQVLFVESCFQPLTIFAKKDTILEEIKVKNSSQNEKDKKTLIFFLRNV